MASFTGYHYLVPQMLLKQNSPKKVNTKKKTGRLAFLADKTLHVTLALSLLFHLGLMYTIPAVNLLPEGVGGVSSNLIVVDFAQEPPAEMSAEVSPVTDAAEPVVAANPPPQTPPPPVESPSNPPPELDLPTPPPMDKSLEAETPYALLANAAAPAPKREPLQKQPVVKPAPLLPQTLPELPKAEKLTAAENSQKKLPEEKADFPLAAFEKRPAAVSPEIPPADSVLPGKRPAKEIDRSTTTPLAPTNLGAETSGKLQLGPAGKDADGASRWGIFVGDPATSAPKKEVVPEAALVAQGKKEAKVPEETKPAKTLALNNQIEGPVKGRRIVYQPPLPQIDVAIEVEFELKFWVLPDGSIGEVLPLKRGDAKLEGLAIAYLKKWQFEPLPPGAARQQEVWGTLPIRFTLH